MRDEYIVETSNLSKVYSQKSRRSVGKIRAVDGVDMKVVRGTFLVILGPSGSGKTTLLNLLGALDKPTMGNIILDGVDITNLRSGDLVKIRREKVGFVFQAYNLIPTLTAIENVEAALAPTGIPKNERVERAKFWLEAVDLKGRTDHLPTELSAGEQQRVAIARAFTNDPKILLLDEPTGNLDTRTGRNIMELLRQANKERGQTVVAVTHAGYVRPYSDSVLYMRDGKIYEREPSETGLEFEEDPSN